MGTAANEAGETQTIRKSIGSRGRSNHRFQIVDAIRMNVPQGTPVPISVNYAGGPGSAARWLSGAPDPYEEHTELMSFTAPINGGQPKDILDFEAWDNETQPWIIDLTSQNDYDTCTFCVGAILGGSKNGMFLMAESGQVVNVKIDTVSGQFGFTLLNVVMRQTQQNPYDFDDEWSPVKNGCAVSLSNFTLPDQFVPPPSMQRASD
jgi:hypothetical protein